MSKAGSKYVDFSNAMTQQNKNFVNSFKSKSNLDDKVKEQKKEEFLNKIGNGDVNAINQYSNALVSNTNHLVESQLIFADFFNRGTMDTDQKKWFYTLDEPVTDNEAKIFQISQHGNAPTQGVVMQGDTVFVQPYWVTSDEVSMSRFNLRMGDISNEEKMRARAAKGMRKKIESDAKTILDNGLITSGVADIAGIDIDSDVSEYPDKTVYDLSSEGAITMKVFKEILKHFMLLGKRVMNIYVPATKMTDLWDWMSMPAGYSDGSGVTADDVVPGSIQEQIVRTGTVNNLFGYPVNLIPVNTLNGNSANGDVDIWVRASEGAGEYRTFPEPISSTDSHKDAQRVYFEESKALSMFQTPSQRLNYAKFTIA